MIQVDTVTIHPRSIDYPLWREQLEWYSPYFEKNIVCFSGGTVWDFSSFVREVMNPVKTIFVESRNPTGEEDWRNVAVNQALEQSLSEWVLFLEPDFFWRDQVFLNTVFELTKIYNVLSFWEANRLHPAFLLVKRELIEKTRKDFGTIPDKLDHFGKFSQDLKNLTEIGELDKLGFTMGKDWYHMQGLTHNYNLCRDGNLKSVFKRDEFATYNSFCLKAHTKLNPLFKEFMEAVNTMLLPWQEIDWLKNFWRYYD